MMIGRARLWAASSRASRRVMPPFMAMIAYSTSRIEFLAAMPSSIRMPIRVDIEKLLLTSTSSPNAPPIARGRAAMMVTGWAKLRNSSTSTTYISRMPVTSAAAKPVTISWMNSASPAATSLTPAGRFLTDDRAWTRLLASPTTTPSSSAVISATRARSWREICDGPAP